MATFYRCDRCGKEETNSLEKIEIPPPTNRNDYRSERRLDFCNECVIKLNQFVDKISGGDNGVK